jgi:hypothetical protein
MRNGFLYMYQWFTARFSVDLEIPFQTTPILLPPDGSRRGHQSVKGADRCSSEHFSFHITTVPAARFGRLQFLTRPRVNHMSQTHENRSALVGLP